MNPPLLDIPQVKLRRKQIKTNRLAEQNRGSKNHATRRPNFQRNFFIIKRFEITQNELRVKRTWGNLAEEEKEREGDCVWRRE